MRPRLVTVEATELPAVTDMVSAMADGAPLIHEELGSNVTVHWDHGGVGDMSVFEPAPVVVHEPYHQPRLIPNAMEPRGCLAYGIPTMASTRWSPRRRSPTSPRSRSRGSCGIPESQAPGHRARRGRRVRVQAECLRRRGARRSP